MTEFKHYDDTGTVRFVTFACYRRLPSLNLPRAKELLLKHIAAARQKHHFKLFAYVLMPDHVHLVLWPPDGMKMGLVIREIKSRMAREYFQQFGAAPPRATRVFWQRRCFDHNCRTADHIREKIEYCHMNPVTAGLVREPAEWTWSSCGWYQGDRDVPLAIDEFGF